MTQEFTLGFRMLVKYPGLTLAGGLALTIAIGVGAGLYQVWGNILSPTIPLPEGDRPWWANWGRDAPGAGDVGDGDLLADVRQRLQALRDV